MYIRNLILSLFVFSCYVSTAQMGVGTTDPYRSLEVYGGHFQRIRVHSTTSFNGVSGMELIRGDTYSALTDWRILNDGGTFKIQSGNFKLFNAQFERLRITSSHKVGLNNTTPASKFHILSNVEASLVTNGYIMLGQSDGYNLIMDNNEINARNNGAPANLIIQSNGWNTVINDNGGQVRLGLGSGRLGIGTLSPQRKVSVHGTGWQTYLINNGNAGSDNDWYIGASGSSWTVGDDQLLFSPSSSSNTAKLRLRNVTENDGNVAPVSIRSAGNSQELLIDGNEIDSKNGSLYINHNSGHNTYFNPSGGEVGVGTTSTDAALSIYGPASTPSITMQRDGLRWDIMPDLPDMPDPGGGVEWYLNDIYVAQIQGYNGAWSSMSDERSKTNVQPSNDVLSRIKDARVYSYAFKSDKTQRRYLGVMAQEIKHLFPETVLESGSHTGVSYRQLATVALKAIQEQQAIIHELETTIAKLEAL